MKHSKRCNNRQLKTNWNNQDQIALKSNDEEILMDPRLEIINQGRIPTMVYLHIKFLHLFPLTNKNKKSSMTMMNGQRRMTDLLQLNLKSLLIDNHQLYILNLNHMKMNKFIIGLSLQQLLMINECYIGNLLMQNHGTLQLKILIQFTHQLCLR